MCLLEIPSTTPSTRKHTHTHTHIYARAVGCSLIPGARRRQNRGRCNWHGAPSQSPARPNAVTHSH
eukprot:1638729-Alexandrium_andersonii.AAC.1